MYQWQSMLGKFEYENKQITFHGETTEYPGLPPSASIGNLICDQRFSGVPSRGKYASQRLAHTVLANSL
jgi:hypothetical protein